MKIISIVLFLFISQIAMSQEASPGKKRPDPIFPARKKINFGLLTTYTGSTPPPVFIIDATIGISKKVSMGIVWGTTGAQLLYGLKVNTMLFQKGNLRGVFRLNAIYYPGRDGKFLFDRSTQHTMPWMFTMGIADVEWTTKKGLRWFVGGGYLETHCIDGMLNFFHITKEKDEDSESAMELFNVLHAGVSIPISQRISLRPEVVIVMQGFKLIEAGEYKVSPINPYLNVVYHLGR